MIFTAFPDCNAVLYEKKFIQARPFSRDHRQSPLFGAGLDIACRMLAKGDMSNVNTIMKLSAGVIMSDSPFVENVHVLPRGHADMNMI